MLNGVVRVHCNVTKCVITIPVFSESEHACAVYGLLNHCFVTLTGSSHLWWFSVLTLNKTFTKLLQKKKRQSPNMPANPDDAVSEGMIYGGISCFNLHERNESLCVVCRPYLTEFNMGSFLEAVF